jgi:serine/threonine protein kinase
MPLPALLCPVCQSPISDLERPCSTCGSPLGNVSLEAGTLLAQGRYRLDTVLGQGGFGITYLAWDQRLARQVALKELFLQGSSRIGTWVRPPALGANSAFEEAKQGFLQESQRLAQFSHPGIVRVWDSFEENGTAYLVMECLEGETLGQLLERENTLPVSEVIPLAEALLAALEGIHALGILHRDLKPDNIFLCKDGRKVLIDFGSARAFDSKHSVGLTRMVTPGYAPPEQYATRAKFGPYTDLYALAATLYHTLAGEAPPAATDRLLGTELPKLARQNPTLERTPQGQNLARALERALALPTDQRPQNAREFLQKEAPPIPVLPMSVLPMSVLPEVQPLPILQKPRTPLPTLVGFVSLLLLEWLWSPLVQNIRLEVSLAVAAVFWVIRRVRSDHVWGLAATGALWGLFLGFTLGRGAVGFALALFVGLVLLWNRNPRAS